MADINNIRTLEDLTNVVSQLYYNLNKLDALYYNMFITETPMLLELERYDEKGQLTTVTLKNRAMDRMIAVTGVGNPSGITAASVGTFYIDTASLTLYYKSTGNDAFGWVEVWSAINFRNNIQYLAPDGNGDKLQNLNADNVATGILNVMNGGTGTNNLKGLVKANGSSPFTSAIDGEDYLGPDGMTGIICYYPVGDKEVIPNGWLRCDGSAVSRTLYSKLYSKIGTTYGSGDGSTTFNIPNLYGYFIRCWDGQRPFNVVQPDSVGTHQHNLEGTTGLGAAESPSIMHGVWVVYQSEGSGGFYVAKRTPTYNGGGPGLFDVIDLGYNVSDHVHPLVGATKANALDQKTCVENKPLCPIIKY